MKTQYERTTYAINIKPWDGASGSRSNPERALWQAVLYQAICDLKRNIEIMDPENRYFQTEAVRWFIDGGRDFHMVCDLAGAEPSVITQMAKSMVERYRN